MNRCQCCRCALPRSPPRWSPGKALHPTSSRSSVSPVTPACRFAFPYAVDHSCFTQANEDVMPMQVEAMPGLGAAQSGKEPWLDT